MSSLPERADAELLLEHASWMRKLARGLVGDAERAEDLSQETWVRALERPPRTDVPVRGWLATVMRNLWRQTQRGDARRTARERVAARGEELASSAELVERVTAQKELVAAVLELEEPYRTAVLMRYFEELSPKDIARTLEVPVSTVKTRLARGLERLRRRLDQEYGGDGKTWLLALVPVAATPAGKGAVASLSTSTLSLGALAVNLKLVVSVLVLIAGGGLLWFSRSRPADPVPPRAVSAAQSEEAVRLAPAPERDREALQATDVAGRRGVPAPVADTPVAAIEPGDVAPAAALSGRVIDALSRPVASVEVLASAAGTNRVEAPSTGDEPVVARTRADGSFSWSSDEETGGRLVVRDAAWETVLSAAPAEGCVVVVGPRIALSGRVVDEFGLPLEASLEYLPPDGFRGSLGAVLDGSQTLRWKVLTDAEGRFSFPSLPALRDATLLASAEGHVATREPAPAGPASELLIVLRRPELEGGFLTGEVVDASGSPVEDALVSLGFDTVRTEADGRFGFELDAPLTFNHAVQAFLDPFEVDTLQAVAPGLLPGSYTAQRDGSGDPVWPDYVTLRLGETALAIAGRVVDDAGAPVPGAMVWIGDPTFFGGLGDPAHDRFPDVTYVENEIAGAAPGWRSVQTDENGRFLLEGLLDRRYTVEAMRPDTLLRTRIGDVAAGSEDLTVVLSDAAAYPVLRGKVVDQNGRPVPGVAIRPMCDAFRRRFQGQTIGTSHLTAEPAITDTEGRFTLHDVPRDLVYLRFDGEDIVPDEWGRGVEGGLASLIDRPERIELVALRRCHFQVELADPEGADQLAMLDAHDQELEISEFLGRGRRDGPRHALVQGRSSVLAVGDAAATLVLFRNGEEVQRISVHLTPGETTVLRP